MVGPSPGSSSEPSGSTVRRCPAVDVVGAAAARSPERPRRRERAGRDQQRLVDRLAQERDRVVVHVRPPQPALAQRRLCRRRRIRAGNCPVWRSPRLGPVPRHRPAGVLAVDAPRGRSRRRRRSSARPAGSSAGPAPPRPGRVADDGRIRAVSCDPSRVHECASDRHDICAANARIVRDHIRAAAAGHATGHAEEVRQRQVSDRSQLHTGRVKPA